MGMLVLLTVFVSLQLVLVLLDVWEVRRRRGADGEHEPLRWRTLLFLVGVTVVFFSVQLSGGWLAPQPMEIMESAGTVRRFGRVPRLIK